MFISGELEINTEREIFGMTGGSPDHESEYTEKTHTQSAISTGNRSYFDPPIENYWKMYRLSRNGSQLSAGTSNNCTSQ